jgi:hypothetical protein
MLQNVYLGCAAFGGAVLVLQTLASMLGAGHADGGADLDDVHPGDHGGHGGHGGHGSGVDADAFLKLFTLKTIVAFLTFFGLGGLAAQRAGVASGGSLGLAVAAGAIAPSGWSPRSTCASRRRARAWARSRSWWTAARSS